MVTQRGLVFYFTAKNTQLLLARCQAEIAATASNTEEPVRNDDGKPVISIEEWRPKEPAHVEKARLAEAWLGVRLAQNR